MIKKLMEKINKQGQIDQLHTDFQNRKIKEKQ